MYIRFAAAAPAALLGVGPGLFGCAHRMLEREEIPDWLRDQIGRQTHLLGRNLAVPRIFVDGRSAAGRPQRRRALRGGRDVRALCWFDADAARHVAEARQLAWLIEEAGLPMREIHAEDPGQILWRDAHQVVARRDAAVTRALS